jgi:TetR/AcrR family transcriptional regulator, ethionamide resistance regulator
MSVLDKRARSDPRRQATKRAFLQATEALLSEGESFADLNVTRIAERAGRTRTAFYVHFEDRRELLLALLGDAGADAVSALEPFLRAEGPITRKEVVSSSRELLAAFRKHASLVRAVIEAAGYDDQIAAHWRAIVSQIIDGVQTRLALEGLPAAEAKATATVLVWMTERACYQQAVGDSTGLDDTLIAGSISNVWWSSVCTQRAQGKQDGKRRG